MVYTHTHHITDIVTLLSNNNFCLGILPQQLIYGFPNTPPCQLNYSIQDDTLFLKIREHFQSTTHPINRRKVKSRQLRPSPIIEVHFTFPRKYT